MILGRFADDFDRLAQPVFDLLAVPNQEALLVVGPVPGRFPWELAVPFADRGVASRADRRPLPQTGRPEMTERGVLDAAASAAGEERHIVPDPLCVVGCGEMASTLRRSSVRVGNPGRRCALVHKR